MSCLPHGHPRMWLGAEDSRIPGHHCWASRGGQPEEAEWLGPSPRAQGLGLEILARLFLLLLPPSVLLVTLVGPYPCLCVSLPSFTLHVLSVWAFCFCMFLSAPPVLVSLPCPMHSASLSCPTPIPCHFSCILLFCPVGLISPSLCSLCSICQFFHVAKEKKGGGIETQKKPKQKLILSVLQSAASSWWPLCVPVACSLLAHPTRLPCVLPACPPCPSCQRHGVQCLGVW